MPNWHTTAPIATVLFLHASAGSYGADRQLEALVEGLDRQRFRPVVVLGAQGGLVDRLRESGVEVHVRPLAVLARRLSSGRGARSLAMKLARDRATVGDLARQRGTTIVHTNSSILVSGQAVAERAGALHVQHVREIYDGSAGALGVALWPLYRRLLLRADALPCVSRAAAAQFDGSGRALVLHDGLTWVPRRVRREEARDALGLDPDRFVVGMVGRVSDWKGQHLLAQALADPALADIQAIGIVAGEAAPLQRQHETDLIALRDGLGLAERFKLLGFREDLETVFGAVDVLAVPSSHPDAFPNTVLEAAASSVPVVAMDIGGLPEMIVDGQTGRLVPAADVRRLASVLRELADDPEQGHRLGEAAAAEVRSRFGLAPMISAVEELYDVLLAARGPVG
ncbi:MAG: glycosyltransferase [Solirubrobacteraceae bacterium]